MQIPKPHSKFIREFFFWSGIVATIFYRAIVFFNGHSKIWVELLWYPGTIGFIIYFAHRYQISERRAALLEEIGLQKKLDNNEEITADDRTALKYIVSTLQSSKERINYIVIFVSSGIAVLIGAYLDFLR